MRLLALLVAVVMFIQIRIIAEKFVEAKIANDSSIAADTRRIAEAVERAYPAPLELREIRR